MSSRLPLLIALVALALGLGGGLWYALREDGGRGPLAPQLARDVEAPAREPGVPETDLVAAEPEPSAASDERVSAPALAGGKGESFDLAGAQWIEVRVAAPAGSPPDDSLVVLGLYVDEDRSIGHSGGLQEYLLALGGTTNARNLLAKALELDAVAWARREVDASGVVRLPFPKGAAKGTVALDARYLYLEELEVVDLTERPTSIVLEPALGAWITGRCVLPPGAADRGVTAESLAGNVSLEGTNIFDASQGSRRISREEALDGPEFELRGIPAGVRYFLGARVKDLAAYTDMKLTVEPGEHREYEVVFELGGALSGRVTDETGAGIEGVSVRISGRNVGFLFQGQRDSTETGAEGRWAYRGVPPGKYRVNVEKSGWKDAESGDIELAGEETISGVDLVLTRGTSLSGRVTWPDGRAAVNASVVVQEEVSSGRNDFRWTSTAGTAQTDAAGAFTVTGLGEGPFDVLATLRPENPAEAESATESEAPGDEAQRAPDWRAEAAGVSPDTSGLTLVLTPPLGFQGVVHDDAGAPVTEFAVTASAVTNGSFPGASRRVDVEESFTAEDGTFTLVGVYPGEWTVSASAAGYTFAQDPAPLSIPGDGAPVELVLSRSASVSGRVVDPAGAPVAGARVAESSGREERSQVLFVGEDGGGVETDAEGRFRIGDLAAGGHSLVARSEGWAASAPLPVDLAPAQDLAGVVLELRVGGRIVGEVFDESGAPIPGRRVSYGSNPMQMGFGGGGANSETTDSAGRFVLEHVEPGTWTVTASPGEDALLDAISGARDETAILDIMTQMLTAKVEVHDGEEVHVTLGAEPKRPVRVFGKITKSGTPVGGAQVFAIQEGGALMSGLKMQRSADDGSYEVTVDRPGAYVFGVGGEELMRQVEFPVDVPDADELELDLVAPVGRIEGTVRAPGGAPAQGVPVRLTTEGGGFSFTQIDGGDRRTTGADGRFAFEDLWPGTYTLRAGGTGRFGAEGAQWGTVVRGGIELAADATVSGVDVTLSAAGKLEGLVRDGSGAPVAGVAIFVRDAAGRLLSKVSSVTSDAAGRFTYPGIAPGRVTVSARGPGVAARDTAPVDVHAGESAAVELTVEPGTTLVVTVVDDEGEPVRASLTVTDEAGRAVEGMFGESAIEDMFTEGVSTREHEVGPLAAGKYVVHAKARDGREAKKPVTVKGQEERRLKVRLKD